MPMDTRKNIRGRGCLWSLLILEESIQPVGGALIRGGAHLNIFPRGGGDTFKGALIRGNTVTYH